MELIPLVHFQQDGWQKLLIYAPMADAQKEYLLYHIERTTHHLTTGVGGPF